MVPNNLGPGLLRISSQVLGSVSALAVAMARDPSAARGRGELKEVSLSL